MLVAFRDKNYENKSNKKLVKHESVVKQTKDIEIVKLRFEKLINDRKRREKMNIKNLMEKEELL